MKTWHDGFHLFDEEALFDLKNDPLETTNVGDANPALCEEAKAKYSEWHQKMMDTMPAGWGDPLDTVLEEGGPFHARGMIKQTGYDKRLAETGRSEGMDILKKRHPQEFGL
jgi:hypothetical protein